MKLIDFIHRFFKKNDEILFEMANPRPEDTGLPMCIFISPKGYTKHFARIKVCKEYGAKFKPYDTFTVTIQDSPKIIGDIGEIKPKDIEKVKKFIIKNKDLLIKHWKYEISDKQFLNDLKKIQVDM